MDKYKNYDISFSGLKNGKHEFELDITQKFFDLFETENEFTNADIKSKVFLNKHTTFLEFVVSVKGNVDLVCDVSNEVFTHPIENEISFLVKFGEDYDDSNEEVIVIPQNDGDFNISQIIYEAVTLSIPMKKLCPNLSEKEDYQILLDKFSPKKEEKPENIDPRWETLNQLKNK